MKPTHLLLPRRMRRSDSVNRVWATVLMFWTLLPSLYGQSNLRLLTRFDQSPNASVVDWMEKEVARLFSDAGLSISWQQNLQMNHWEITGLPVSVQFRGNCRIEPGALSQLTDGPMGWIEVQGGDILPLIEVDCGRIAEMVWQVRGTVPVPLVNRALGLALGRVMAHELYHYLTRSTIHTESRLFRKGMASMDLTLPNIQFDAGEIEALRTGMR